MMTRSSIVALLSCAALLPACGSSDEGGTDTEPVVEPDPTGEDTGLPPNILTGTNGTMPCEPLPDTGFEGDELCILPPEEGTGAFLHAGPGDYDDPDQIAAFTLAPSEETTEYYIVQSQNADTVFFRDQHFRMRPGSHHLIMYTLTSEPPGLGWQPETDLDRGGPLGGTQVYVMDFPEGGKVAPEDVNLVRPLVPETKLAFEMHYVNATSDTILREAWVNLMQNQDSAHEDYVILGAPFLIGAQFSVPPQATQVLNYEQPIPAVDGEGNPAQVEMRIVSLFGHRHASTGRFSIWLNRDGAHDLVYEDYDWQDAKEFFYNSLIENPAPDAATATAGAVSGQLFVQTGDTLEWECEMTNTLDEPLEFGNGVYVKEMCNVFGTLTSTGAVIFFGAPSPTITTL